MNRGSLALALLAVTLTAAGCTAPVPGQYVDVDRIYPPVQQMHQTSYRSTEFDSEGKRIAIMDFKGDAGSGQVFADILSAELFNSGVNVVERQNVEVLTNEMRMAEEGSQNLTDTQILQRLGRLANVDVVIVGGIVNYDEEVEVDAIGNGVEVSLPFQVTNPAKRSSAITYTTVPASDSIIYRWRSAEDPTGLPVYANVYASARAIDVVTGEIVWIDTVNVQTRGISQVTGLERLGVTMAKNLTGEDRAENKLFIFNGQEFSLPSNWSEVTSEYPNRWIEWQTGTNRIFTVTR